MRYILYMTILFLILPFVLSRPFFGLCIYYIVSILQPKFLCWRPEIQDAMIVGVPLVIGAIMIGAKRIDIVPKLHARTNRVIGVTRRLVRSSLLEPAWPVFLFGCLIAYLIVNRVLSPFSMEQTGLQFRTLCKVLLVVALMTGLASDYRRFRILIIVIGLAAAFWAIKGGIKVVLLGPHQVYGKTYDNNLFALTSVMALPIVFYFGLSVRHARWRAVLLVCSAMIILAIIGSRSRAGFVAMAFVVVCMALSSRYRIRALFAVALVGVAALAMVGDEIQERVHSIIAYRQDRSAHSRLEVWDYAQTLLAKYPVMGVGFNHFETARRTFIGSDRAAHNIFLQNMTELGVLGHPIWLAIIFGSIFSLFRFMRWSRVLPPEYRWAYYWSRGLLLALVAFCIHGLFHNEEYSELMFAVVGLNVALQVVTRRELQENRLLGQAEVATQRRTRRKQQARGGRPTGRRGRKWSGGLPPFGLRPGAAT